MKVKTLNLGPLQTNCYVVVDEETNMCAIIDPADNVDRILSQSTDMGLVIDKILLTHMHFDHIGALNKLCDKTNAEIYIGKYDAAGLALPHLNLSSNFGNPLIVTKKPTEVCDKDRITIGNTPLTVMHTPGHTQGSVCYISHHDKVVFSGDTLFYQSIGRTDFPTGDYDAIIKSLDKVLSLDGNYTIYSGHGPATNIETEKRFNPYYNHKG